MKTTQYLRFSGELLPDNRLHLNTPYPSDDPRGAANIKDSPLQIECYKNEQLLLRWGAALSGSDRLSSPKESVSNRSLFSSQIQLGTAFQWFRAKVPIPSKTKLIVFRHGDIILHEILVPEHKPVFKKPVSIKQTKQGYRIDWNAKHHDNIHLHYNVRTSADGGESWNHLALKLTKPGISLPRNALLGGKNCLVEVIAYDGVNTTTSRKRVPNTPPVHLEVRLLEPRPTKKPIIPPIQLRAVACVRGKYRLQGPEIEYLWIADGKTIGTGSRTVWCDPEPGAHKVTVQARSEGVDDQKAFVNVRVAEQPIKQPASVDEGITIHVRQRRGEDTKRIMKKLTSQGILIVHDDGGYSVSELVRKIVRQVKRSGKKGLTLTELARRLRKRRNITLKPLAEALSNKYGVLRKDGARYFLRS